MHGKFMLCRLWTLYRIHREILNKDKLRTSYRVFNSTLQICKHKGPSKLWGDIGEAEIDNSDQTYPEKIIAEMITLRVFAWETLFKSTDSQPKQ